MKATVLIIEDEPDLREIARFHLEGAGYDVVEAADGGEALDRVQSSPPDVILLDLRLPGADGWTVLGDLRRHLDADVPVIVLSAHSSGHNVERAAREGCRDYVRKPFTARRLLDAVRNALASGGDSTTS